MEAKLTSVVIESTNFCNAKCVYCTHSIMKRTKGYMPDFVFKKIIEDCKECKDLDNICMQIHGEPTLLNCLNDRLCYIRKNLPNVKINLISNGAKLTEEIVSLVDHLDFSFNYALKEDYEKGMGLDYDFSVKLILSLDKFKDKISIHFVSTKDNIGQLELLEKQFPGYTIAVNPLFSTWNGRLEDKNILIVEKRIICDRMLIQLPILWNGDAIICCNDYEGVTSSKIGNVLDKSILELFYSDYLQEMRKVNDSLDYTGTFCEKCNSYCVYK
jgi:MoaA/NifB/PqqE/SkfB family radical SAM enzyme